MSAHIQDDNIDYLKARGGILSWLGTSDHKRIGLMFLASILAFFAAGCVYALLLCLQLWTPAKDVITSDNFNRFFTMHGVIMVFLVAIPGIPGALGNFILPIQIGARGLAFPKLNLTSLYLYWIGGILVIVSLILGRADSGWTFYAPYSLSRNPAVLWMLSGATFLGFSSILTGLNFIVTVHKMRAPGMTWFRLPLFIWTLYSAAIVQVFATPVLITTSALLLIENFFHIGIFDPSMGGDPLLMQHFFWFYANPAVYVIVVPAFGIAAELIAAFSKKEIFSYKVTAFASVLVAVGGFLTWGHHMFASGQSEVANVIFSFLTFLTAVPSAIIILNLIVTLYQGSIELKTPLLYGMQVLLNFTIGGLSGAILAMLSVNIHLHDTSFVTGHFHYMAMGAAMTAFIGGIHYWWPKMTGRMYNETIGRFASIMISLGFNATFIVQIIMGSQGSLRRYYHYPPEFRIFHQISTVGAIILAVGLFIALINLLISLIKWPDAQQNPWGARTLEWEAAETPPVLDNFSKTPVVTHGPYDFATEKAR